MAKRDREATNENGSPPSAGLIGSIFEGAAAAASKLWHAITDDGHLAAAGRQGIDELGAAFRPFPDSIQTQETGTIWNPTQGEIAADRQHARHRGGPPHPWPSEIANQNRHQPGNDHGDDCDHDNGHSM